MTIHSFDKSGRLYIFKKNNYEKDEEAYLKNKIIISKIKNPEDISDKVIADANVIINTNLKKMKY